MKEKDCIEYLSNLEMKYPVEKWVVNGRKVWPLIRFRLLDILMEQENTITNQDRSSFIYRLKSIMRGVLSLWYCLGFKQYSKADVLVLHDNPDRNIVLENGKYYDHNLDPIIDFYEKNHYKCISLEMLKCSYAVKYPFYSKSKCINFDLLKCRISSVMQREALTVNMPGYEDFRKEFPELENGILDLKNIGNDVKKINAMCEYFKNVIVQKSVKLVILECWYSSITMSAAMACYDLGIPCMDVQHGLAGAAGHRAYYGWKKFDNDSRYEVMPSHFWSWSLKDAECIMNWGCRDIYALGCGKTMFLDEGYGKFSSSSYNAIKSQIKKLDKICILVTLQTAIFFPNWFIDFIREHSEEFVWIIRCHPYKDDVQCEFIQSVKNIKHVFTADMDVINLDLLLNIVNVHITMWSAVTVDAYFCGVPSIILSDQYIEELQWVVPKNFVYYAKDEDDLLLYITEMIRKQAGSMCNDIQDFTGKRYLLSFVK